MFSLSVILRSLFQLDINSIFGNVAKYQKQEGCVCINQAYLDYIGLYFDIRFLCLKYVIFNFSNLTLFIN